MDRNPSPPPESGDDEGHELGIGTSSYSETFVLNTLKDVLEAVQSDDGSLSEDLETRICSVWDMTTNEDVVGYILTCDIVKIIAFIVEKTENPRLAEIVIGIASNILCALNEDVGTKITDSDNDLLKTTVLSILRCRDTRTLIEATRALCVALEKNIWRLEAADVESCLELDFIIGSTTNDHLLSHSAQCLDLLLDQSEPFRQCFCASDACVSNLIEGLGQAAACGEIKTLASLFHICHQLTTQSNGLRLVRDSSSAIFISTTAAVHSVLTTAVDREGVEQLTESHWSILASAFSIWRSMLDLEWKRMVAGDSNFGAIAANLRQLMERHPQSADSGAAYDTFLVELEGFTADLEVHSKNLSTNEGEGRAELSRILHALADCIPKKTTCD